MNEEIPMTKDGLNMVERDLYERIEDLEKKVEERGENFKIYNVYADMNKEIAKLRDHDIFRIWNSMRTGGKTTLKAFLYDVQRNTEVLRELGEDYIGHIKQGHPMMVVLGEKGWLAKLDGASSASHTEFEEYVDQVLYPYIDKHIIVETKDLEWLIMECEQTGAYTHDKNRLRDLRKKYLEERKPNAIGKTDSGSGGEF